MIFTSKSPQGEPLGRRTITPGDPWRGPPPNGPQPNITITPDELIRFIVAAIQKAVAALTTR